VIESTEALTVIDVNSGKFTGGKNLEDTIVKTNIEAAAEIARQVRLRDIGGIIVCDFIDMSSESGRNKVLATLETGLRRDRTRTTIQSFSALGLLEFTRKRVGKDLAGQLRGKCPTCEGLGTVMSPESMSIEAYREIRQLAHERLNGRVEPRKIGVSVAPTVGAQLAYWYENETAALEREVNAKVALSVDQALHPERLKISFIDEKAVVAAPRVRVGDEIEAELLQARLPNPASALAVVDGRLAEVENAAGAVGQTIKIKIIDISEDGAILAEPRTQVGEGAEKHRHRRRGRGRELTPAEQSEEAEELRELAEEAAKGLGNRPPLGISTGSEPDVEDAEARARAAQQRGVVRPPIVPQHPAPPAASRVVVPFEAVSAATAGEAEGLLHRRRRRRRRRGRGGAGLEGSGGPAGAGIPQHSLEAQGGVESYVEEEPAEAGPLPLVAASYIGEGGQRRRRRRRRRGGAGRGQIVLTPENQAVPERHIFRAAADGRLEATGQTAPPEPTRALAPVRFRTAAVAVSPPPPSLKLAPEDSKVTRPARRRRDDANLRIAGAIEAPAPIAALPRPMEPSADEAAPTPTPTRRRVTRKAAVEAEPIAEAKPKKTVTRKVATTKTTAVKATVPKAATSGTKKKTSVKKTTTRKVATRKKKS